MSDIKYIYLQLLVQQGFCHFELRFVDGKPHYIPSNRFLNRAGKINGTTIEKTILNYRLPIFDYRPNPLNISK